MLTDMSRISLLGADLTAYAVGGDTIYISADMETFIPLRQVSENLNAVEASLIQGLFAIGDSGQIIREESDDDIEMPSDIRHISLLDIAQITWGRVVIVGENGTIIFYDGQIHLQESNTTADLTAVIYDKEHAVLYVTSSDGELLTSPDGKEWQVTKVCDARLNAVAKEGDTIVLAGDSGTIYYSTDGENFTEAVSETTDDFVDVLHMKHAFVAATRTEIYTSPDGETWLKDIGDFSETNINALYADDEAAFILTEKGIRQYGRFGNAESGVTKSATLSGVDVAFVQSSVEFENGNFKAFNIVPNDTMHILKNDREIGKITFGSDTTFQYYDEYVEISGDNELCYNADKWGGKTIFRFQPDRSGSEKVKCGKNRCCIIPNLR